MRRRGATRQPLNALAVAYDDLVSACVDQHLALESLQCLGHSRPQAECAAITIEIGKSSRNLSLQGTVALTRLFPQLGAREQRKLLSVVKLGNDFILSRSPDFAAKAHRVRVTANSGCFGHTPR
jgi:hypothetical protein